MDNDFSVKGLVKKIYIYREIMTLGKFKGRENGLMHQDLFETRVIYTINLVRIFLKCKSKFTLLQFTVSGLRTS